MVTECIVVMRGFKEVSWKQAKAMMSEANFLKSLTELDVDGITSAQVIVDFSLPSFICFRLKCMISGTGLKTCAVVFFVSSDCCFNEFQPFV